MDLGLTGKIVFVAGSSKGLGKASARELAREGANVVISGRNEAELQRTQAELLETASGRVEYVVCDVTKPEHISQAIRRTADLFGTVDILVNNAGGPPAGTFDDFTDEVWIQAFEQNLLSHIRLIREVLPYMKKQQNGRILNIASSSVKQPIPGLIISNTLRTGVAGLAKTLSLELAPHNILVHTVAPGRIATDRVRSLDEHRAEKTQQTTDQVRKQAEEGIPLGRYGEPEEFGKVVAFLASSASSYLTGSTILVDGGMIKSL
ncbi:SDR family oxidoreductase [Paenibacillus jamilae]|uniref:SDR family oxidoreductase n=1 Tax=Paenibacillus TaxID=44249 RepID=UPI00077C1DC7|nr:SDR family oxidoreductase [Paenibacillus polymyxa]KYG96964.1 3-oxoacyl-ACP reductase [Paenibacillus polymyxa]